MKKLIAAAALLGGYLYLIAPQRADKAKREALSGRNYAHRGLHNKDRSIPENCLVGFQKALDAGYGMEFDVHITKDDQLVVFHDNSLQRMCGVDGVIEDLTLSEIRQLRLAGTEEKIPSFDEVLALVDGRAPLIIELKDSKCGRNDRLCQLVAERLDHYNGPYCIESFHPLIVAWFRRHRPDTVRGQLVMQADGYKGEVPAPGGFLMSRGLTGFLTRPNFIAHRKGEQSLSLRLTEALGAMRFVWTVHPEDGPEQLQKENDGLIFEFCNPDKQY